MENLNETNFSREQEIKLNEVLAQTPNLKSSAELDKARIAWLMRIADLFDDMKLSREKFKEELQKTHELDKSRLDWWLDQAEKYSRGESIEWN